MCVNCNYHYFCEFRERFNMLKYIVCYEYYILYVMRICYEYYILYVMSIIYCML